MKVWDRISKTMDAEGADVLFALLKEKSSLRLETAEALQPGSIDLKKISLEIAQLAQGEFRELRALATAGDRTALVRKLSTELARGVGRALGTFVPSLAVQIRNHKNPLDHIVLPAMGWLGVDLTLDWWISLLAKSCEAEPDARTRDTLQAWYTYLVRTRESVKTGRTFRTKLLGTLPKRLRKLTEIPSVPLHDAVYKRTERFFASLAASSRQPPQ